MRVAGLFLLLSGWIIVICAIALLHSPSTIGLFLAAGMVVELLGLILVVRSHLTIRVHRSG